MSSEKQIEEMAIIIHDSVDVDNPCLDEKYGGFSCFGCDYIDKEYCQHDIERARALYNAGYRKQSEGEWKDHYLIKVKCPDNGYPSVKCSACETVFCDIINNHHFMYRFCPNCGANMKGGTE